MHKLCDIRDQRLIMHRLTILHWQTGGYLISGHRRRWTSIAASVCIQQLLHIKQKNTTTTHCDRQKMRIAGLEGRYQHLFRRTHQQCQRIIPIHCPDYMKPMMITHLPCAHLVMKKCRIAYDCRDVILRSSNSKSIYQRKDISGMFVIARRQPTL